MKGTKIKHLLASALLILPLALQVFTGAASVVNAADTSDGNAYIRLHKLQFDSKTTLPTIDDPDGSELTGSDLQEGKPLAGVEFTAYDVTAEYNSLSGDASTRQKTLSGADKD